MPHNQGLKRGHENRRSGKGKKDKKDKNENKENREKRSGKGKKDKKMDSERKEPKSREREHKLIVSTANDICADIQQFSKKFLSKDKADLDFQQGIEALQKVYEMWEMETVDEIPSWKVFEEKQTTQKIEKDIRETEGFKVVEKLIQRAKYFEALLPTVRKRLIACLQYHLYKYCKSFEDIAEGYDIQAVSDYQEAMTEHKSQINDKLDAVNENIIKYGELKKPFAAYIREGKANGKLIGEVCLLLVEICHIMKAWVRQDIDYPEKLHEESQFSSTYNDKLLDDGNNLAWKRQQSYEMLERRERYQWRLELEYDAKRREKRRFKKSKDTVEMLLEKLEKNIADKEYEIEIHTDEKKGGVSPRNKALASEDLDVAKRDLVKLNERKASMQKQHERLEHDYDFACTRHDDAKKDLDDNETIQNDLKESINDIDLELKNIKERTDGIQAKVNIIRTIRELTLSSETLRKIHQKRRERAAKVQEKESTTDPLEEACKFVADKIGNDWKKLYPRLPFYPTRDSLRRLNDIEIISSIGAKNDWTDDKQAFHCFSKWRNFNRRSDVAQLSRSLRMTQMKDLAKAVEKNFLVKSSE